MQPCEQGDNIRDIKAKIEHIDKTLYFGNGKPALTAKIDVLELKLDGVSKDIASIRNFGYIALLGLLSLLGLTAWQMFQRYNADTYYRADKLTEASK